MTQPFFYQAAVADRATQHRSDREWIRARLKAPDSRFVPIWRESNLVTREQPARATLWRVEQALANASADPGPIFLGVTEHGAARFAIDVSRLDEHRVAAGDPRVQLADLWSLGAEAAASDAGLLAYARGVIHWHRMHRYCGVCGSPTSVKEAGHLRVCPRQECGRQIFPRTDPAVIMLVTSADRDGAEAHESCLLGRQTQWPEGMYAPLAGFIDAVENLEEGVAREVLEETGIRVSDVRYMGSQPWPFPSSMMIGFTARALTREIAVNTDELEDARWFTREQLHSRESSGLLLPRRHSISRYLLDVWLNQETA